MSKFLILFLLVSTSLFSKSRDLSFLENQEAAKIVKGSKSFNNQTDWIFRDGLGREVYFHGTNMTNNAKGPMWDYKPFSDPEHASKEITHFKNTMGGNLIRWLFVWEGPHKDIDTIDYAHLDGQIAQIKEAIKRNIYILIDFHQDLFSRHIKDGSDGAPKYIIDGMDLNMTGCGKICPAWSVNYITNKGVRGAFQKFFNNVTINTSKGPRKPQDEFFFMLRKSLSYIKEKLTPEEFNYIVGLDPMNEPTHGYYEKKEKYNDWVNNKLFPFYKRARAVMDEVGYKDKFIFAEPATFWNVRLPLLYLFVRPEGPLKLKEIPEGNWVFNAHSYDEVRESYGLFKAENGVYLKENDLFREEARRMKAPTIMTEHGAWFHAKKRWVFDPYRILKANYQSFQMSMSGKKKMRRVDFYTPLIHNTQWAWWYVIGDNPTYNQSGYKIMERSQPRRVQGDIMHFFYNDTGRDSYKNRELDWVSLKPNDKGVEYFEFNKFSLLAWRGRKSDAPTEIYLPKHFDPNNTVVITDKKVYKSIPSESSGEKNEVFYLKDSEEGGYRLFIFDDQDSDENERSYHFAFVLSLNQGEVYPDAKLEWFRREIANSVNKEKNPLFLRGKIKFDRTSFRYRD